MGLGGSELVARIVLAFESWGERLHMANVTADSEKLMENHKNEIEVSICAAHFVA